ncbi:MAG TPA: hypothetical protein V6D25_20610 [Leptolyngbyaceae cyanobacterium]
MAMHFPPYEIIRFLAFNFSNKQVVQDIIFHVVLLRHELSWLDFLLTFPKICLTVLTVLAYLRAIAR